MSDNISRKSALDALRAIRHGLWEIDIPSPEGCPEYVEHHEQIKHMMGVVDGWIKKISEEEQASDWIPCSERLPEEHEWIGTKQFGTTISDKVHITFDVNGERFVKTMSLQNGELSNHEKHIMDTFYKGWKMIAWMPLPEAYKGGE